MDTKEKYGGILILEGARFDIIAAVCENGNCPFWDDYYRPLAEKFATETKSGEKEAFIKLNEYLKRFSAGGIWPNREQLKPVEGTDFFEFKVKKTNRVFFYYDSDNKAVVILTHHTIKKKNRIKKSDLERMESIRTEFTRRRKKNEE